MIHTSLIQHLLGRGNLHEDWLLDSKHMLKADRKINKSIVKK